ncbi:hypothetical protein QBC33DRAFT_564496 [Phialemonium atrogriseum]|uniref:Uncharacterized protein n=1 Tax=Phialemonium atrogriseum TaxID=1093897 RepID=A0AAJ0BNT1_9PEZI|nr:uncharacterized protein QBC33DRAFT_564496 [Phialemonium atrogriseum]KAK1761720.1 hypothetical protein QBC33DRAFT_564496 [Phialemonium atrogriseum]
MACGTATSAKRQWFLTRVVIVVLCEGPRRDPLCLLAVTIFVETNPQNPANAKQLRVPIYYKDWHEIDKFFKIIPPAMQNARFRLANRAQKRGAAQVVDLG